jgi:hypothetical protein
VLAGPVPLASLVVPGPDHGLGGHCDCILMPRCGCNNNTKKSTDSIHMLHGAEYSTFCNPFGVYETLYTNPGLFLGPIPCMVSS